jgi:D-arabinose 1-dehydrogenase-like Zn-dependent alcohol dehydrogenase
VKAVRFEAFGAAPAVVEVDRPVAGARDVVVAVKATGLCRSDWHAWQGHDDSVSVPHIPGHEFAGVVVEVGAEVSRFRVGDRVTAPFILACGRCEQCRAGDTQVCPNQRQPGFTLPGSFAEFVAVVEADVNLVRLPDEIDFVEAAALGCRFGTAFHAVRSRADVRPGEWVAVYGCGGVGLSVIMVARAAGAEVVAVDPSPGARDAAAALGAIVVESGADASARVRSLTRGGAHVSVDAYGSAATCLAAIAGLRPRGRHVQVGLLLGADANPDVPMGRVIAEELDLLGSHGISIGEYAEMLDEIVARRLRPDRTIGRTVALDDLPAELAAMGGAPTGAGLTVAVLP